MFGIVPSDLCPFNKERRCNVETTMVSTGAPEALAPPGGGLAGKGSLPGGPPIGEAGFQSLMASLMGVLMAGQMPMPVQTLQPAMTENATAQGLATLTKANGLEMGLLTEAQLPTLPQAGVAQSPGMATALASVLAGETTPTGSEAPVPTLPQAATTLMATGTEGESALTMASVESMQRLTPTQTMAVYAATTQATSEQTPTASTQAAILADSSIDAPDSERETPELAVGGTQINPGAVSLTGTVATPSATATAAPKEPAPVDQVADAVQIAVNNNDHSTTIRLQPAELGGVRIRLQMQNGQLHLSIEAERPQTGRLLEQQMPDLRQTLESGGIKLGDLSILGGRNPGHVAEALQRETVTAFRTVGTEMSSNHPQQQQSQQQQAAFAGGEGMFQNRDNGRQYGKNGSMDGRDAVGGSVVGNAGWNGSTLSSQWLAGVDYYA